MGAIAEIIQAVALLTPGGGQVIEEILLVDWKIKSFVLCIDCESIEYTEVKGKEIIINLCSNKDSSNPAIAESASYVGYVHTES